MTDPIATVGASSTPQATTTTKADRSQLDANAFLQLLVAQLKYQDPSKPVDTASLMTQTATINQIQTMQQLSDASTATLKAQQVQTATNLVGRTVTYTDGNGATASGYVSSASLSGTAPTLRIGKADVALTDVTSIAAASTG